MPTLLLGVSITGQSMLIGHCHSEDMVTQSAKLRHIVQDRGYKNSCRTTKICDDHCPKVLCTVRHAF